MLSPRVALAARGLAQGMQMMGESWFDEKGVLLRSVLTAPFGTIETALVEPANP